MALSHIHIQLLGDFRLECDAKPVNTVNTPRLQSLLAYLLLHRYAPQPRQHVSFVLWPDSTEAHARGSMRKLLHQLTHALPNPDRLLDVNAKTIQWHSDAAFTLDVAEFENAAGKVDSLPALRRAVELYRGDLLPSCYDDWIIPERERLLQLFITALERIILLLESQRDYRNAINYAQTFLRHAPVHEEIYRQLMRLYASSGDRAGALHTYHTCATVLERELNVEPSAETRQAYEQILNIPESLTTAGTLVAAAPLVGRREEWACLQSVWNTSATGQAHFVLLSGTAGIGKTRLAEEMLEWARRQGITVMQACSYAAEGALAYAPVAMWLRARTLPPLALHWKREVARLLPELLTQDPSLTPSPLSEEWQRQHFFEALARALLEDSQPLMLLIDDLQWCDRGTIEWLHYLLRFVPHARLLIIGTVRLEEIASDHPFNALITALHRNHQITEIGLTSLDHTDTIVLASQIVGQSLDPRFAAQIYRETEGNPLFVVEMARAERIAPQEAKTNTGVTRLPLTMQAVIRARLATLSESARELASVGAAIGREFTFDILQRASGKDEDTLVRDLDELWQRRIVSEQGTEGYDFTHDKLREVVYADLSAARRRTLHHRVAHALQAQTRKPQSEVAALLAYHFECAGENDKAFDYWLNAGNHALQLYAPQQAIQQFERALALAEHTSAKASAYWGLGRAYFMADDLETSASNLQHALQDADAADERRAKMLYQLADVSLARYDLNACEMYALAAQTTAESVQDFETICSSLSLLGQVESARGHVDVENELITHALSICRQSGNRWREGRTLADLGWLQAQRGEFAQAIESAQDALQLLTAPDDRAGIAFAWNTLGRAYGGHGDYVLAFDALHNSQEVAVAIGHRFFLAQMPNLLGWLYQQLCDYTRARKFDEEGLELARRWNKLPAEISADINLGLDILHLDKPAHALAHLRHVQERIERTAFGFHAWRWRLRLLHAQGLCQLTLGASKKALALAAEGLTLAQSTTSCKYIALNECLRGMAFAQLGSVGKAKTSLKKSIALADEMNYQPLRWEGRYHLAQFERESTRMKEAAQIIESIAQNLREPECSTFLQAAPIGKILRASIASR